MNVYKFPRLRYLEGLGKYGFKIEFVLRKTFGLFGNQIKVLILL